MTGNVRPPLRVIETGRAERLVNVRYEDLLRAVGYYIDQHGWHDVLITQIPEGILLKGVAIEETPHHLRVERVVAVLFTNEDIMQMLDEGMARRRKAGQRPNAPEQSPSRRRP